METKIELTDQQILNINQKCPYNQGIFREPFGIPDDIKELVIYTKWESGGRPGSCWDDEDTINEEYECDRPNNAFKVLELILKELNYDFTPLQYEKILKLSTSNEETDYGYYGDYTEETIEWILLSDLYRVLNEFKIKEGN